MKLLVISIVLSVLTMEVLAAIPYPPPGERNLSEDYNENLDNLLMRAEKRGCVRRGGGCDGKPNSCCENSACRCNLWGTNCRCERAGLFQQWGK